MKRSVAAGRSRRAVGGGVGRFLLIHLFSVFAKLGDQGPVMTNASTSLKQQGGGKQQQPGSYELGGASVHFVSLSHAYKYSSEKK